MTKKTTVGSKPVPFRMDPTMQRHLDEYARSVSDVAGTSFDRSAYIRDCVGFDLSMWRKSPYTAARAYNCLLVTRDGAFVFYRREHLRLHGAPEKVSVGIQMKHEKIRDYLRHGADSGALARAFRLNMFVCKVPRAQGETVYVKNDVDGITSKSVEFDMRSVASSEVTVETVTILEDYVQRCEPGGREGPEESLQDEAAIDVEIPAELLEFDVVLDNELYAGDSRRLDAFARLSFKLKNTRGATYDRDAVLGAKWNRKRALVERIGSNWDLDRPREDADAFYEESVKRSREWVGELAGALRGYRDRLDTSFVGSGAEALRRDLDVVLGDEARYVYVPRRASFYRLIFRHCRMGLRLAINWIKPERRGGGLRA